MIHAGREVAGETGAETAPGSGGLDVPQAATFGDRPVTDSTLGLLVQYEARGSHVGKPE